MIRALAPLPLAIALIASLSACAAGPQFPRDRNFRQGANPSAAIAAELAFAQLAQAKGQWTAFRETATGDAVMFVPQAVQAQAWLKNRPNPASAVTWQPQQVWSSCDGSIAVTRGAWQNQGTAGIFTTVWQRQKDGGYKWVLDQGEAVTAAQPVPEMIAAKVATCKPGAPAVITPGAAGDRRSGASADGTLRWHTAVRADCGRDYIVSSWNGTRFDEVYSRSFAAPPATQRPAGGCA
ncbi:hypothetical protein ACOYW6_10125 [Parablastomonas sp. CN1-191]|uniref:hypothetical protein n=1 Tax=Parablastomonas sp. CN1-191 TaxID=3400908 RepID=UPI003BF8E78C